MLETRDWAALALEAREAQESASNRWLAYLREAGGAEYPNEPTRLEKDLRWCECSLPLDQAKLVERQSWFVAARARDEVWLLAPCVPSEISRAPTEEIQALLVRLGVEPEDVSRDGFRQLSREPLVPWVISERWIRSLTGLTRAHTDFLGLAAWQLWERFRPELPSDETLDDWLHEAYVLALDNGDPVSACELWFKVWSALRPRIHSGIRTTDAADGVWVSAQFLSNWLPTFVEQLLSASAVDPAFAPRGVAFAEDVLTRFRDEDSCLPATIEIGLAQLRSLVSLVPQGPTV